MEGPCTGGSESERDQTRTLREGATGYPSSSGQRVFCLLWVFFGAPVWPTVFIPGCCHGALKFTSPKMNSRSAWRSISEQMSPATHSRVSTHASHPLQHSGDSQSPPFLPSSTQFLKTLEYFTDCCLTLSCQLWPASGLLPVHLYSSKSHCNTAPPTPEPLPWCRPLELKCKPTHKVGERVGFSG